MPRRPADRSRRRGRRAGRGRAGSDVQFVFGQPAALLGRRDLPARQPDVRADDDQAVTAGATARPDLPRGERSLRFEPGERLRERRTAPVARTTYRAAALEQPEHDDLQVGVVGGIHHDPRAAGDRGEDIGHPVGPTLADVGQADRMHLVGVDRAAALLRNELAQVRGRVAEGGVLGELTRPDRDGSTADHGPVDVARGEPAGLEVGRDQQHAVEPGAGDPAPRASIARISVKTCPRRVESLRPTTSTGASRA